MPTFAVLADPPEPGVVLPDVAEACSLTPESAADLYEAMLADVCTAIEAGGGDLLVNYRDGDAFGLDVDAEARLRDCLAEELEAPADARYEVQVGESFAGRVGNTVTHLLDAEGVTSAVALEPTAAFFDRRRVGTMGMKLRSADVVCCPALGGGLAAVGFADPIDFEDAYAPPAVETITRRAVAADLAVDFLDTTPTFASPEALASALPLLRATREAGRPVPPRTTRAVQKYDVSLPT